MAQVRPYRGVEAPERLAQRRRQLLDAGLDLLGAVQDPPELTVRAVCAQAGVSARYFYESFSNKDELVTAIFDWVIGDIAATTQAAVAAAPREEQNRAGITNLVRTIAGDARVGRLLFDAQLSNAVVARKRAGLGEFFALLSGQHMASAYQVPVDERVKALSHFVTGGVTQTLSAWVSGHVALSQSQLVDHLTQTLDDMAPRGGGRPA